MKPSVITVIGAGSWGTALAMVLANNGYRTYLWGNVEHELKTMAEKRSNPFYLPNTSFPDALQIELDLTQVVKAAEVVIIAVPSTVFGSVLKAIKPRLQPHTPVIWGTKGFDGETGQLLHEVASEILGKQNPAGMISGPSFAKEVADGVPTAVVAASQDTSVIQTAKGIFGNPKFLVASSSDIIGVEICSIFKNILAIATGLIDGLQLGTNTRCALMTLGLAEAARFGQTLGAQFETFMGLAGVGDTILTCTDDQSRNRRFGLALGQGQNKADAVQTIGQVVEGVHQIERVVEIATQKRIPIPITKTLQNILSGQATPDDLVTALFSDTR